MVSLRTARPGEIGRIQAIGIEADERFVAIGRPELADGETIPQAVAEKAMAEGRLLVALVADELAGWVYLTRLDGELCIGQISVSPRFGRLGIGTTLLRRVIEQAKAAAEASIVLNTEAEVPWNGPWYARHGFDVIPRPQWSEALANVSAEQTAGGLDWSSRVHMRLDLAHGSTPAP